MTELYRRKQQEIQDAKDLAQDVKDDLNYIQLQYHDNTSIPTGLNNRVWIGDQGPSNGISLVAQNNPQVNFTKKGTYKFTVQYRSTTDIWTKWGVRGDTSGNIKGESVWAGGSGSAARQPSSFSFIAEIDDLTEDYVIYSVTNGSGGAIQDPIPPAGNIGHTDVTITCLIEEIKRLD